MHTSSSANPSTSADKWVDGGLEATTIIFRKGGKCGIPVKDGISTNYNGLKRRNSRPFEGVNVIDLPRVIIEVSDWTLIGTPRPDY